MDHTFAQNNMVQESKIRTKSDSAFYNGLPFSGLILSDITGDINGTYLNGIKQGKFTSFYANNIKKAECTYNKNLLDGLCTEWFKSGNVKSETMYILGKKEGLQVIWHDIPGKKKSLAYYKNDHLIDQFISWYESGRIHTKVNYDYGNLDGLYEEWYDLDNIIKKQCRYEAGLLNEPCKEWDLTGNPVIEILSENKDTLIVLEKIIESPNVAITLAEKPNQIQMIDTIATGVYDSTSMAVVQDQFEKVMEFYDHTDVIRVAGTLKNGKKDSIWTYWYPNSRVEKKGKYMNDHETGQWIYWDQQGDSLKSIEYLNGQPIKIIDFAKQRVIKKQNEAQQKEFEFLGLHGVQDSFLVKVKFDYPDDANSKSLQSSIMNTLKQRFQLLEGNSETIDKSKLQQYAFNFSLPEIYVTTNYENISHKDFPVAKDDPLNLVSSVHNRTWLSISSFEGNKMLYQKMVHHKKQISSREEAFNESSDLLRNNLLRIIHFVLDCRVKPLSLVADNGSQHPILRLNGGNNLGIKEGDLFWVYGPESESWPVARVRVRQTHEAYADCVILSGQDKLIMENISDSGLYARYMNQRQ